MLKGDKYFELIKAAKFPEIMRAHKDRNSFLIYLTRLTNKGFTLPLIFSFTFIFSDLSALSDALLGRRFYNNVLMVFEIRFLFQLNRDNVAQ
jgi:hypothetical protein